MFRINHSPKVSLIYRAHCLLLTHDFHQERYSVMDLFLIQREQRLIQPPRQWSVEMAC